MKNVCFVVAVVTLFAIFYHISPYVGLSDRLIFFMFLIAPFLVLYMVYVILKYGKPSEHTFEERFYEDWDGKE